MTYLEQLRALIPRANDTLKQKGIQERYLQFGGPGTQPVRRPTIPTDARSEFLANRAMGDWAERILAQAIRVDCPQWKAVPYGNADRIAAGEPGFKDF